MQFHENAEKFKNELWQITTPVASAILRTGIPFVKVLHSPGKALTVSS